MRILQVVRTMNIGGLENFVKNMLQYLSEKSLLWLPDL